ncbi:MAG TPA: TIGR03790 family protein, partial [Terrimicrobiaceae bacterium]
MIAGASDLAPATVVVFNSTDPASEALARYYAERRHIDPQHLVGLRCSLAEEISRSEYENNIARPLREIFLQKGWWRAQGGRIVETRVRLVALIRGIPFKISSQGAVAPQPGQSEPIASRDEASVDSELAVLATNGATGSGLIPNPYYRSLIPVRELVTEAGLLLVCRLDAPSETTVRRMIDSALIAEKGGLWGWAYVDSRSIRSGGYAEGDNGLTEVASDMRRAGVPVLWEKSPETLAS